MPFNTKSIGEKYRTMNKPTGVFLEQTLSISKSNFSAETNGFSILFSKPLQKGFPTCSRFQIPSQPASLTRVGALKKCKPQLAFIPSQFPFFFCYQFSVSFRTAIAFTVQNLTASEIDPEHHQILHPEQKPHLQFLLNPALKTKP